MLGHLTESLGTGVCGVAAAQSLQALHLVAAVFEPPLMQPVVLG